MKKVFILTTILAVLLVYACQKNELNDTAAANSKVGQIITIEDDDDLIYQPELESYRVEKSQIRSTIEAYLNGASLRNTMDIAQGIWTIETGLNHLQGNARTSYQSMQRNEYHYFLASSANAQLSSTEVDAVIATIESQVLADKNAAIASCGNGKTIFVNITPFKNASGEVIISAMIGTGTENTGNCITGTQLIPNFDNCSFTNQTGEWRWSNEYDSFDCVDENNSAANQAIQALLNYNDPNWPCPLTQADESDGYFADIIFSNEFYYSEYPNPDDDVVGDGFRDYLLFQNDEIAYCFSPDDMTFYYHGAGTIINQELDTNSNFAGKEFVSVTNFWGDCTFTGLVNCSHFFQFTAGVYVE